VRHCGLEEGFVNWLTLRLAALDSFDALYGRGEPCPDSPLRRVAFDQVEDALRATRSSSEFAPVLEALDGAHLYTESADAARERLARAEPAPSPPPGGPPLTFTVALADPGGHVLYLPDDDQDHLEVQLFAEAPEGVTGRLRLDGDIDPDHAHLTRVRGEAPVGCADGPCSEWNAGCGGDGCRCRLFESEARRVFERLRVALGVGATRHGIHILKCHR
jgi:hypothetical protein